MADAVHLSLRGLQVSAGAKALVRGVDLDLRSGEIVAMVGGSGSGKTLTARALLGLVRARPGVTGGSLDVHVDGTVHRPYAATSARARARAFRPLRGAVISYLPQDARAALDPTWTVRAQLEEVLRLADRPLHTATDWLARAGFPSPKRILQLYPHELSGGMAQRAAIALSIARGARLLLADEPTTGLDPTVQADIMHTLAELRDDGLGVLFITHDLRLVSRIAHSVVVMDGGEIAERLPADQLRSATHPTTQRLVAATARVGGGLL